MFQDGPNIPSFQQEPEMPSMSEVLYQELCLLENPRSSDADLILDRLSQVLVKADGAPEVKVVEKLIKDLEAHDGTSQSALAGEILERAIKLSSDPPNHWIARKLRDAENSHPSLFNAHATQTILACAGCMKENDQLLTHLEDHKLESRDPRDIFFRAKAISYLQARVEGIINKSFLEDNTEDALGQARALLVRYIPKLLKILSKGQFLDPEGLNSLSKKDDAYQATELFFQNLFDKNPRLLADELSRYLARFKEEDLFENADELRMAAEMVGKLGINNMYDIETYLEEDLPPLPKQCEIPNSM